MWGSSNLSTPYNPNLYNQFQKQYMLPYQPVPQLTAAQKEQQRYEQGDVSTPSNAQLKSWGITRDQYRSLYNQAAIDWANAGNKGKWGGKSDVNEINQFLKKQMVNSNGQYGNQILNKNTTPVSLPGGTVSTGGSSGGGGGSSRVAYTPVEELQYYTADELAKRFGIVNDYATILKELQDATTKKFDETETTMKRAEATNLRGQETAYNQYLTDLRSRAANAVSSGATKGTMSANALSSLLGMQDANREGVNTMNDLLFDIAQQRGTALSADMVAARNQSNEIGQFLGGLSTSMDTNAINLRAAQLAADAQRYSAGVGASATTNAARIQANSQYDQIINAFTNNYLNKGYNQNAAGLMAYTDYTDLIKNQYAK